MVEGVDHAGDSRDARRRQQQHSTLVDFRVRTEMGRTHVRTCHPTVLHRSHPREMKRRQVQVCQFDLLICSSF